MAPLISDLRYSAREFRRRPYFTLTAIFSLALGIGATTAVFSLIYAVLINPFPYSGADRIVELRLKDQAASDHYVVLSGPQLDQLRQARSIESVIGLNWWNLTTTDGDLPEDLQAVAVTTNSASHFGIPALKGRWFIPSDAPPGEDPQRVTVLSYQFWQRYFVGDPRVVGRKLQLVHDTYEVIGVMPPRFKWDDAEVYIPLKVTQDPGFNFGASLKLRPGVTPAQADAELQPLIEQFAKQSPSHYPDNFRVDLRSIVELRARPLGPTLYLLLGAVASLLLIGCANVSILLLA
jgi:MacB-like periplasmic core domain